MAILPSVSTYRARQRWEIRTQRPAEHVIAYFEDSLAKTLAERIDGVDIERRSLDIGRTVGVRADGFVIMFSLAPVRGGHPFRRSLRRRGVVDLTGTVIVSDQAADIMVLEGGRRGRVQQAVQKVQDTNNVWLGLLACAAIGFALISPWLSIVVFAAFIFSPGVDDDELAPMLPPPETAVEITAVHLWAALCDDVGKLVSATNLVPALIDGGAPSGTP